MFAPSFWARDISGCISCPPHYYAPTEGLSACLPCGSRAQQPVPGQDKCVCLAEGQVFQASDGQCHCALGYRSTQRGEACELKIYAICKDGQTRDQYGKCLDGRQWKQLCSHKVCAFPQLYEGYDASLGLCICKSLTDSGRSECSGWCGDRIKPVLQLVCSSAGLQLLYTEANGKACVHNTDERDNLFNTNAAFDWGVFRVLEQELAMSRSANSLFSVSFSESGVYVLKLSSNQHKHVILFREHGWPEKLPFQARYRDIQLKYNMDDYSSKGSRVIALKKMHRNLQVGMNEDPVVKAIEKVDEFWDYEEQVNLEAFSSSTFYEILLKHSVSVTSQLGQLKEEVKQVYQGVLENVRRLRPDPGTVVVGGKLECLERQVKQEIARRKVLGSQISQLLERQLQILRNESQSQHAMHRAFSPLLRECLRLLMLGSDSQDSIWNKHIQQCVIDRVSELADEMAELVSIEAQRQGCWVMFKQGTGARLLCPTSGSVLDKDDIIGLVLPMAGNVGFDPSSSTLVCTADACMGKVGKWESHVIPFIPYPSSHHSDLLGPSKLRSLQTGQKLVFGGPMYDYETGILVPILAVTIHPQTGIVYPLGGVHVCPVTRLQQPIQIGCPMLDHHTGNVVLITGVSLDSHTGAVLPVGGLLLGESFIEPLSSRMVRVGGGSIRAGKVVPHAGGFQALLDSQALRARMRLMELIHASCDEWKSGSQEVLNAISRVKTAASDLEQAWRNSQLCMLQLLSCLEAQQEWALWVAEDGGSLGEISLPDTDLSLPALPGLEYPDPGGSGLLVPVLGVQFDWMSGRMVPLAGTMEDADGKGLIPIRFGAQTVDPVTGVVASVIGARLDVFKRTVIPVTVSQHISTSDSVLGESLQKECNMKAQFWRQQRVKEDKLVADLERALQVWFYTALQKESNYLVWMETEKQIKEAAAELQDAVNKEAQRRNAVKSELSLLLPGNILLALTRGDEEEWRQQHHWHTELTAVLNRVSLFMAKQQWEQDRSTALCDEQLDEKTRQKKQWEQLKQRNTELDVALSLVRWACECSQLHADTAEAILSDSFMYRDYSMVQLRDRKNSLKAIVLTQHKILPHLQHLIQLLDDGKLSSLLINAQSHQSSEQPVRQMFDRDMSSRVWTVSVPIAKDVNQFCCAAVSAPSMKGDEKALSVGELNGLRLEFSRTSPTHAEQDVSPAQSQDAHNSTETFSMHMAVPKLSDEDWASLLERSPLFQLIKDVEHRLRDQAQTTGLLSSESPFIDFLDAQWDCEGTLVKVNEETLNPREFLIYQYGQLLLQVLHTHRVAPALKLHLASSLPTNNYHCNAFRNSFHYQEMDNTLYVRHQRLQSIGKFSLLLLHCAAHISTGQLSVDTTAAFQRAFFKAVAKLLEKHKKSSVFRKVESLLRDTNLEVSPSDVELPIKHEAEG
ncbi:hypothetical protein Baya_11465 [Bagarius yarrelli]|uniref:Uncharacterized protein n=1 Tax=Bagarius yarrelli TaxID=175774 RepID=A0A556V043_BAGYA|nr:hypothetical protein Baya_11465 [Bagarius yarrelli]